MVKFLHRFQQMCNKATNSLPRIEEYNSQTSWAKWPPLTQGWRGCYPMSPITWTGQKLDHSVPCNWRSPILSQSQHCYSAFYSSPQENNHGDNALSTLLCRLEFFHNWKQVNSYPSGRWYWGGKEKSTGLHSSLECLSSRGRGMYLVKFYIFFPSIFTIMGLKCLIVLEAAFLY